MDRFDEEIHEYKFVKFRMCRNEKNLVNGFDDVLTASVDDRSWKRQTKRKSQWKIKKSSHRVKKHSKFRGHPTWVYPVFEMIRVWRTTLWNPVGYWSLKNGKFIGYKLQTMGRWAKGWKERIYSEEEVKKRGYHVR